MGDSNAALIRRIAKELEMAKLFQVNSTDGLQSSAAGSVREALMRNLFGPRGREEWLKPLAPPAKAPANRAEEKEQNLPEEVHRRANAAFPEISKSFKSICQKLRQTDPPIKAMLRAEDPAQDVRLLTGWEEHFCKVALAAMDMLIISELFEKESEITFDEAFHVIAKMLLAGSSPHAIYSALGIPIEVLETVPQFAHKVKTAMTNLADEFKKGRCDKQTVLIAGVFAELYQQQGLFSEKTSRQPVAKPSLSIALTLALCTEAAHQLAGWDDLARCFGVSEAGLRMMTFGVRTMRRMMELMRSGSSAEELESSSSEEEESDESEEDTSIRTKEGRQRWKDAVRGRLKKQKATSIIDRKTPTRMRSKPVEEMDVVYVVGPDGQWTRADVVSVVPQENDGVKRFYVKPWKGDKKPGRWEKKEETVMYSEAQIRVALRGREQADYTQISYERLGQEFSLKLEGSKSKALDSKKQASNWREAQVQKEVEKLQKARNQKLEARGEAMRQFKLQATLRISLQMLVKNAKRYRQKCKKRKEPQAQMTLPPKYANHVKKVTEELRNRAMRRSELLNHARGLSAKGHGAENYWIVTAFAFNAPWLSPNNEFQESSDVDYLLQEISWRFLTERQAIMQWFFAGLAFVLFVVSMPCFADDAVAVLGVCMLILSFISAACFAKAHAMFRNLLLRPPERPNDPEATSRKDEVSLEQQQSESEIMDPSFFKFTRSATAVDGKTESAPKKGLQHSGTELSPNSFEKGVQQDGKEPSPKSLEKGLQRAGTVSGGLTGSGEPLPVLSVVQATTMRSPRKASEA